jgi:DNA-binding beta-propeller fold protein YncE
MSRCSIGGWRLASIAALAGVVLVGGPGIGAAAAVSASKAGVPGPAFQGTLGGPGAAAMYPSGADFAPNGDVVVADTGNDQIAEYNPSQCVGLANPNVPPCQVWRIGGYGTGIDQFLEPRDVAVDQSTGDIFVADNANNRVVELNSGGGWMTSWQGNPKMSSPIGIGVANGLVYVANGGKSNIRVFSENGTDVQTIASVPNTPCQLKQSRDVAVDPAGNVFVANYEQDDIVVFSSNGSCLFTYGSKGTGNTQFKNPYGIAVGTDPNLGQEAVWVADSNNERVQEFTVGGSTLNYKATIGKPGNYSQPGTFTDLRRVAVDAHGDVLGSDLWGFRVEIWNNSSGGYQYSQTIGAVPPGLSNTSVFNQDREASFDASGDLYVADTVNQRFVEMGPSGNVLGACGLRGFQGVGQFNWPRGVAVDPATGYVWVANTKQSNIQILQGPTATQPCVGVAQFGKVGSGSGQLNWPMSLAIRASDGTAWVADTYNNRIDVYSTTSPYNELAIYGGLGGGSGQFNHPQGIAIDPNTGNILVADTNNNRIVELAAGADPTAAGISVVGTYTDNLRRPAGVTADSSSNIIVADTGHSQVKAMSSTGTPTWTLTGTPTNPFNYPAAVTVGPNGDIYVSDTINDTVDVFGTTPLP